MATKKLAAKNSAVKKPAAKKSTAKKPAAKSSSVKKPVAKNSAEKKKPIEPPATPAPVKRVPPRIVRKVPPEALKTAEEPFTPIDTEKAVAFAMSIAEEMKRNAAQGAQSQADD